MMSQYSEYNFTNDYFNYTSNASTPHNPTMLLPPVWLKHFYEIFVPIFVAYCLISMAANVCVLVTIRWIKGGVSATLRLTVSLALSDVCTSALLAFSFVYNSYLYTVYNIRTSACVALTFEALRMGGLLTGTFHFFVLAVNHYLSTAHPFLYKKILTPFTTNTIILLIWIAPPSSLLICFASVPGQGYNTPSGKCDRVEFVNTLGFRLTIFSLICTLLVAITIMYVAVLIILHRMKKKFSRKMSISSNQTNSMGQQNRQQLKRKRNTFVTTLLIWGTFFAAWLPTSVIFVLSCDTCPFSSSKRFDEVSVFVISTIAQFGILTKTLVNPIIYAVRIPEISQVLHRFYKKMGCRKASTEEGETSMTSRGEKRNTRFCPTTANNCDEQTVVLLKEHNNLNSHEDNGSAIGASLLASDQQ